MGDPGEARKAVVTEPREGCICPVCDLIRFHYYAARITGDLGETRDDDSPRMALIFDLHSTVGLRHPLGIAERLYEAISALHAGDDDEARQLLNDMAGDEREQLLEPGVFEDCAEECPLAAELEKDRSRIPPRHSG